MKFRNTFNQSVLNDWFQQGKLYGALINKFANLSVLAAEFCVRHYVRLNCLNFLTRSVLLLLILFSNNFI